MAESMKRKDPMMSTVSGKLVILGSDAVGEFGDVKYPGRFGIKYGSGKADWVRLSYVELLSVVNFVMENKEFVNAQCEKERARFGADLL